MDKFDRVLDVIEHPENYSTSEIKEILQDADMKEELTLLDKTKSSLQSIITPDVEDEWRKFEKKHKCAMLLSHLRLKAVFTRKMAASIAVGIISITAVAAFVGIGINHISKRETNTVATIVKADTDSTTFLPPKNSSGQEERSLPVEIIVFDNESLDIIISKIAAYYGYQFEFSNEASKSLRLYFRWDQSHSIAEVVERLNNFEQIHITINDKTIKIS